MLNTSTDEVFNMNETQVKITLDAWLKQDNPPKDVHHFAELPKVSNVRFFDQHSGLGNHGSEPSVIEARFAPMVAPA
ncbi:MAG: hypothetical protein PHT38_01185 [Halothiobacillus sp.]|jgi:hypothetical protein|nr:hypothetical protein [Halothiobacillus sp.]